MLCSHTGSWCFVLFLVASSYSLKPTGDKESSDFLSSGHPEETFAIVSEFLLVQTSNKSLQQGPSPAHSILLLEASYSTQSILPVIKKPHVPSR